MKRFVMLVGVAVVAGAMYVAASPASQQSKGPTAKQFNALKKQVATLSKKLKTVQNEADFDTAYIGCLVNVSGSNLTILALPVSQFGSSSDGFLFGGPGTPPASATARTALDVNTSNPTDILQEFDPTCLSASGLRHGAVRSGVRRLQPWLAKNTH
jgi:hypothetical protein